MDARLPLTCEPHCVVSCFLDDRSKGRLIGINKATFEFHTGKENDVLGQLVARARLRTLEAAALANDTNDVNLRPAEEAAHPWFPAPAVFPLRLGAQHLVNSFLDPSLARTLAKTNATAFSQHTGPEKDVLTHLVFTAHMSQFLGAGQG
jgi:hypothetical protein